jgi:hypothetical protein
MKGRVGVAVAGAVTGAVLAAGAFGGVGFAASSGRGSTQTNITSHDPRCVNLELQILRLQLRIASARNVHQARAIGKNVARLQQQLLRECA